MVKAGIIKGKEGDAMSEGKQTLISVILNKGYADDAMAAARKAGAGGGTVINARGTAREDDAKFFGMHIVPEKEMLMISADKKYYLIGHPGVMVLYNDLVRRGARERFFNLK